MPSPIYMTHEDWQAMDLQIREALDEIEKRWIQALGARGVDTIKRELAFCYARAATRLGLDLVGPHRPSIVAERAHEYGCSLDTDHPGPCTVLATEPRSINHGISLPDLTPGEAERLYAELEHATRPPGGTINGTKRHVRVLPVGFRLDDSVREMLENLAAGALADLGAHDAAALPPPVIAEALRGAINRNSLEVLEYQFGHGGHGDLIVWVRSTT